MTRFVIPLVSLALTIYALIDCIQTPDDQIKFIKKIYWIVLVVLIPWVGPIAWLITGRERVPPGRRPLSGPKGPEDDPDFLRGL